jgi:SNF2 family DNA or RNA helicase
MREAVNQLRSNHEDIELLSSPSIPPHVSRHVFCVHGILKELRSKVGSILIRRTRNDILQASLPERQEYFVYCPLSASQSVDYMKVRSTVILAPLARYGLAMASSIAGATDKLSRLYDSGDKRIQASARL